MIYKKKKKNTLYNFKHKAECLWRSNEFVLFFNFNEMKTVEWRQRFQGSNNKQKYLLLDYGKSHQHPLQDDDQEEFDRFS